MKQLQETEATNVANKADFTQCCATKSVPLYKKRRFVELNIGNTALSRATVNFRMGFSRFPYIRILIVCLCMTTLTEVFPCFFLSCKANARLKPVKDGARPALFLIFVLLYTFFVLFYVLFVL